MDVVDWARKQQVMDNKIETHKSQKNLPFAYKAVIICFLLLVFFGKNAHQNVISIEYQLNTIIIFNKFVLKVNLLFKIEKHTKQSRTQTCNLCKTNTQSTHPSRVL